MYLQKTPSDFFSNSICVLPFLHDFELNLLNKKYMFISYDLVTKKVILVHFYKLLQCLTQNNEQLCKIISYVFVSFNLIKNNNLSSRSNTFNYFIFDAKKISPNKRTLLALIAHQKSSSHCPSSFIVS
jgi:hypothetical protein